MPTRGRYSRMPSRAENLETLDRFMSARKAVLSSDVQGRWAPTHAADEMIMKWPLEIGGEMVPEAFLAVTGKPRRRDMIFFRLHVFRFGPVCRLDHTDETHTNSLMGGRAGFPAVIRGPHYHSFAANRCFFKPFDRVSQLHKGTSKNDAAGVNPDVPCGLPDSGQV